MIDTLLRHRERAEESPVLEDLGLEEGQYAALTLHRPSNVDDPKVLSALLDALEVIQADMPVLFPVHPRTRSKLAGFGLMAQSRFHARASTRRAPGLPGFPAFDGVGQPGADGLRRDPGRNDDSRRSVPDPAQRTPSAPSP